MAHMAQAAITFDTLQYAKKLLKAGFTRPQAEVQAEAMRELIDDKLATKKDTHALGQDLKRVEIELKRDIKELEKRLIVRMDTMSDKLLIKLGSLIVGVAIVLGVVIPLITKLL